MKCLIMFQVITSLNFQVKKLESDSDEEVIENSNLNLDKKGDIYVKADTAGSSLLRQKVQLRGSAVV